MPFIEKISAGVPAVATLGGGLKEIVKDKLCYYENLVKR